MKSSSLWQDIKSNPLMLIAVVLLHLVLIGLLSFSLSSSEVHRVPATIKKTVKAVVVDASKIDAEIEKRRQDEAKKKQQKQAQIKKKQQREAEKKRKQLETDKRQQADLKKKQQMEKKKLADLKKKKRIEAKRLEEKKAEEKRQQEKAAQKKADEKKRLAEEKRKKIEEEKRQAEAMRKQQEEQKRKLEKQRRMDEEAELKSRIEEEEQQRKEAEHNKKLDSLRVQYVKLIEQKVERNWLRPASSTNDMSCEVVVTQTSLGDVISVSLLECTDDFAFQRSIERAVRKASPLPPPPDPEVFDREIHFTFRPNS